MSEQIKAVAPKNGSDNGLEESKDFLEEIRMGQDYLEEMDVNSILATVPIRKPEKGEFFRVHPDPKRVFIAGTLYL